jgi:hypothetical protein
MYRPWSIIFHLLAKYNELKYELTVEAMSDYSSSLNILLMLDEKYQSYINYSKQEGKFTFIQYKFKGETRKIQL